MPEPVIRGPLTWCPFQILQYDGEEVIGAGTGFFYEHDGQSFLVTNWHVITGRDPFKKTAMHPQGRIPDRLLVKFGTSPDAEPTDSGDRRVRFNAHLVETYDADGPKWYEHPDLGSDCDVIALPVNPDFWLAHKPANRLSSDRVPMRPGMVIFVVGFPLALSVGPGLPLWKSGYIASEPGFDVRIGGQLSAVGGLQGAPRWPAFFIDAQTRQGMSGAPVFAYYTGSWNPHDPYESEDAPLTDSHILGGEAAEFVGCYSGRVLASEHEAALGLCWRVDAIDAICSAKQRGQNPH